MPKSRKRRPDFRKIRPSKVYSLHEIARSLDRNIATVRSWVRDGLPTLDGQKPSLVLGSELKAWLQAKWAAKKYKCSLGELPCFKCRGPRTPKPGSVKIIPRNEKTVSTKALCSICNTRMNLAGSLAKLSELERLFRTLTPHMQHLIGCSNPGIKHTSNRPPVATPAGRGGGGQISETFEDADRRGCEPAINQYKKTSPILKGRNHDETTP